jgi:hypothetical protein
MLISLPVLPRIDFKKGIVILALIAGLVINESATRLEKYNVPSIAFTAGTTCTESFTAISTEYSMPDTMSAW